MATEREEKVPRSEEKREKEGREGGRGEKVGGGGEKRKKDKNLVLFRWSYASPSSELNKRRDDGRELLFNSLKLYA